MDHRSHHTIKCPMVLLCVLLFVLANLLALVIAIKVLWWSSEAGPCSGPNHFDSPHPCFSKLLLIWLSKSAHSFGEGCFGSTTNWNLQLQFGVEHTK